MDTINNNDKIHIFDSSNTFEGSHDIAYASITNSDYIYTNSHGNIWHFVEISLKDSPGGNSYLLTKSYIPSQMDLDPPFRWSFSSGNAAGVCVDGSGFYEADTSHLHQPFDDAFVSFKPVKDGSGVVPYVPEFTLSKGRGKAMQ